MSNPYWPLFDLRLRVGDLELRPMTEADQVEVADTLPPDLELDPHAIEFPLVSPYVSRGLVGMQRYWRSLGTWSAEAWLLGFCVRRDGRLLGVQELEATDFSTLRTVDSASYLAEEFRGQGVGRLMRRAVLALAFGPLGAEVAITSAWHDNHASLAVSRALGYRDNGESSQNRPSLGIDRMLHLRLPRADWRDDGSVTIENIEPCLPYFGITP